MTAQPSPLRTLRYGLVALAGLSLSACSWVPGMDRLTGDEGMFRDRQGDYLEARTLPRTDIPARYDSYIIDDLYVIPELPGDETTAFLDPPRPRPLEGASDREVVIQRISERSWVIVDASPSQVWPRIRDYWTAKGVTLATENPTAGVMETGWFTLEGNTLTKEKFRVVVETGFQNESSEIRLLHASMPQAVPVLEQAGWPAKSDDPETEYEVLNEMAGYLADVADLYRASSVSLLAGNISSQGKAALRTEGEHALLSLQADYERSWAAVGRALERAGAEVLNSDQAQGLYEVRFTPGAADPEEEEKGFFGSLISLDFLGDDEGPKSHTLRVELRAAGETVDVRARTLPLEASQAADPAENPEHALLRAVLANLA